MIVGNGCGVDWHVHCLVAGQEALGSLDAISLLWHEVYAWLIVASLSSSGGFDAGIDGL